MAKSGRRGNGEGTISLRKDGRWEAKLWLADGKRKGYYGSTRQEVARKLAEAMRDRDKGLPQQSDERLRLSTFLQEWLEGKRATVRPLTWTRYEGLLAHVQRALGAQQLTRITPRAIQRFYSDLQAEKPAGAGLSSTTAHHVHSALRQALASAERQGLIARNPADLVDAPRMRQTEMHTLDLEQSRALLAVAQGDRLEALYVLALATGMRQGELLALRWRDVDLDAHHVQVRGTLSRRTGHGYSIGEPKTKRSRRRLDLDAESVAALRRQRVRQAEERLATGALWESDARWPDLVFTNRVGRPLDARNLAQQSFKRLLERAGLPIIRFHDLRHTAATLMLLQGINVKVVSERLGHASVAITLDRYAHVLPSMQRDAAEVIGKALFG